MNSSYFIIAILLHYSVTKCMVIMIKQLQEKVLWVK